MTFLFSFAEAYSILYERKYTVAVLIAITVGWSIFSDATGINDSSGLSSLLFIIGFFVCLYYGFVIQYGMMRSIAIGEQGDQTLGRHISQGKKFFWRAIGLWLASLVLISLPGLVIYLFLRMSIVFLLCFLLCFFVFMRLWIFAPAFLVVCDSRIRDAFTWVRRVSYGSAKHIFYLYIVLMVFNWFSITSGATKEMYYRYPVWILNYFINMVIFVEAMRFIKARGLDKLELIYKADELR